MTEQILYEDAGLIVTPSYILIRKYYFPLATSKTILFSEVENVQLNSSEGVTHRWGICTKYLNNWFPLDSKRGEKKKFLSIKLKNKDIKPSITPDDPEKVFQIIWENQTEQGRDYVERMSQKVGEETEVAQQEVMDRMKEEELEKQ